MGRAPKLDLYKKHQAEYVAPKTPELVDVGPAAYLTIAGRGGPGSAGFFTRIQCLYGMALTIKMAGKAAGRDYGGYWGQAVNSE